MSAELDSVPLSYLLSRLARQISRGLADVHVGDLSGPAVVALVTLKREPGLSNAQLARRCFVSAQAMSEVVLDLERRGYLLRAADPLNLRILRARLTPSGRRTILATEQRIRELEERLFEGFSTEEVAELRTSIEKAAKNMDIANAESARLLRAADQVLRD
jgi:DNA-binding MarR family transcriptional regulator